MTTTITAPQVFRKIEIAPGYNYNTLTGMFTHLYLHRDLYGSSFTYDDNGNVVNVKNLTNQQSQAQYDDYDNLLSYVQPGSASTEKYTFTYGTTEEQKKKHLPLTSATPMGVKTATEYDPYGNATENTIQPSAGALFMKTQTTYTDNGNYVASQKDARGLSVVNWLDANGKVLGVTDPEGNSVTYAYDNSNRITGVTAVANDKVHKNSYTYENDRLKTISHNTTSDTVNDVTYTFEYDALGRKKKVKVGNVLLSENVYSDDRKGLLEEMNFGNGAKIRYEYDAFGRTTAIYVDEPNAPSTTPKYEFKYDARGIASVIKDNVLMTETRVTSDLADRPSESVTRDSNGNLIHKSLLNYDGKNRVKEFIDILPDSAHKTAYTYDADNRVTEVKFDNSDTHKVNYAYDLLNRVTNRTVTNGVPYSTTYGYLDGDVATYGEGATTPLISTIEQGSGANTMNFAYTYDSRGNITSETRNGVTVSYEYDELGQLIRVNDLNDTTAGTGGTTWVYTYDRGGNILRKDAYSYTTGSVSGNGSLYWNYGYDAEWKDQLKTVTKYNQSDVALIDNSNAALTYDAIGNPLSDGTWTYTWEKGRQLKSMHNAATGVTMEFRYNQNGIRTQKIKKVNGAVTETTDYILKGKYIAAMKKNTDTYYFSYDASGAPATVNFNGANYTYVKNLQGDIVGILDSTGSLVVEYKYDAWGAPISISSESTAVDDLAFDNPFRYRGYVWDEETGRYYLTSRYHCALWKRFINADYIASRNLYCYCDNDPINQKDSLGTIPFAILKEWTELHNEVANQVAEQVNGQTDRVYTRTPNAGKNGNYGYPDVVLGVIGGNYFWEIKPLTLYGLESGILQSTRYKNAGLVPGYTIEPILFQYTLLGHNGTVLAFSSPLSDTEGVVYYHFVKNKPTVVPEKVPSEEKSKQEEKENNKNFQASPAPAYAIALAGVVLLLGALTPFPGDGIAAAGALLLP